MKVGATVSLRNVVVNVRLMISCFRICKKARKRSKHKRKEKIWTTHTHVTKTTRQHKPNADTEQTHAHTPSCASFPSSVVFAMIHDKVMEPRSEFLCSPAKPTDKAAVVLRGFGAGAVGGGAKGKAAPKVGGVNEKAVAKADGQAKPRSSRQSQG